MFVMILHLILQRPESLFALLFIPFILAGLCLKLGLWLQSVCCVLCVCFWVASLILLRSLSLDSFLSLVRGVLNVSEKVYSGGRS